MAYTLLTLRTEVGNQFDSQATSRVDGWIVEAIGDIIEMRKWSWLETQGTIATVSGQAAYVLTGTSPIVPDFDGIISVRHNQANGGVTFPKLRFMKQPEFDDFFGPGASNTGIPIAYTIRGAVAQANAAAITAGGNTTLDLGPSPGFIGSMKVAYYRSVASAELSAVTDVPILPPAFRQAIISYAVAIGKARTDQLIASQAAMTLAMTQLQSLEKADIANRGGDPEEIVKVPAAATGINPAENTYGWEAIG